MKRESRELILSLATVILVVIAISVFIYTGGSYIFYIIAIIAFIVGIVNFWLLSTDNSDSRETYSEIRKSPRRSRRSSSKRAR